MLIIFTLPVVLLIIGYSIFTVIKSFITKDKSHLKPLLYIWVFPICLVSYGKISAPKSIDKSDIAGTYEIDNEFYPGTHADWQKSLFSFVITENNEFYFYEKLADGNYKVTNGMVEFYRDSNPALFRIIVSKPHKLIDRTPALYRQKFSFYYVFESAFGSMFYRKTSRSTAKKS